MASEGLKHRAKEEPTATSAAAGSTTGTTATKNRKAQKLAMAKRGLRSLAVAVAIPVGLAAIVAYATSVSAAYSGAARPFWRPPVWVFHLASLSTAALMGLAGWLVWADGGFHRRPTILGLFMAQLLLSLSWGPLVFGLGATRLGLADSVGLFAALFACSQCFHGLNPIAADLVKPCLAWASFLAVFNYKLL
ncbi:translocator protein homolog [Typha latifolia]|uniref:translocator protein homolog n=1 Tax=Typha latifolia TaxID=4733 RepID=UPI003C2FB8D2